MELVSVIIPYFKKKKFIKEALKSVLKQSYKKLEIIIVYDDQDIKDLDYIKKLSNIDKRIKLIINLKTMGAGISRNIAIKKSKGKFISFLDSDDIWHKHKIKHQIYFMKNMKYLITHTSYKIIDKNKNVIGERVAKNFNNINDLLKSCDIGLSSVIVKRNILVNDCLFASLKTKEDFILWLSILKKNIKIGALKKNLMYWRNLDNSLSSSMFQKLIDGFKVYNSYMKFNWIKSLYFLICLSINFLKKNK